MKAFVVIITVFFLMCTLVFGLDKELFVPYSTPVKIIDQMKSSFFNQFENHSFSYIVQERSLMKINQYYNSLMMKLKYQILEHEQQDKSAERMSMQYKNKKFIALVQIIKINKNQTEIYITQTDNRIIKENSNLSGNNQSDNPGFDLKDIPRTENSIRVLSIISSDKNDREAIIQNGICNIIYKSKSSKSQLAHYYRLEMKKHQWISSANTKFFHNSSGYWMTFKKDNKNCLISILYMKEIKSNIVAIYYGYN